MNYSKLTKEEIIKGIKNGDIELDDLSENLRNNKEIVIEAVKCWGQSLKYASDKLKDDIEVVSEAVKINGYAFEYVSDRLRGDKGLLEVLENYDISKWHVIYKKWHAEKMEVLNNIRNQEEKELMKNVVIPNEKITKKLKF